MFETDAVAGFGEIVCQRRSSALAKLRGPKGRRLNRHRLALLAVAAAHDVRVLGVFGSVARDEGALTATSTCWSICRRKSAFWVSPACR
jgi:hypothetical protein